MVFFRKALGLFMLLFGLFGMFFMQTIPDYQPKIFSHAGIVFGAPCVYLGIYLLLH